MRYAFLKVCGIIATIALTGCAGVNQFSEKLANSVTPEDIVTGERILNFEKQPQEIERATK